MCFLYRNFSSTRSWAIASSSPTSCPLIVWSLSSWTRCYLTSIWVQYECDNNQCDGLCLSSRACQTRCENVWSAWPWAAVKRYLCFRQRLNVAEPYITEIKYLCFTGKIIKSVPSKLIKEVRHAFLLMCVYVCLCGLGLPSHLPTIQMFPITSL